MSPQQVALLTSKLYDADPDIRFMSLNDLLTIFNNPQNAAFLSGDYNGCAKIVDGFLHTINDTNGEVQNLTIKCLGPFVNRAHPSILCPFLHKLGTLELEEVIDRSLPALAIRAIIVSLPRPVAGNPRAKPVTVAYEAISKVLIPRLVGYIVIPQPDSNKLPPPPKGLLEEDLENGSDSNAIDVLIEVARCFGPMLQQDEIKALQKISLELLECTRSGAGMKKKAVVALSVLAAFFSDQLLSSVISHLTELLKNTQSTLASFKLNITILGALAKAIPNKFGPHLKNLAPFVLTPLSQDGFDQSLTEIDEEEGRDPQLDEVREAALLTLDAFLSSCPQEMQRYYSGCTEAALRYLKYDPYFFDNEASASDTEIDTEDDDFELDEDFEEDQGADDEDDLTWKVRRCAARTMSTLIAVRGSDLLEDGPSFDLIGRTLIARFHEREETVRLEVLSTLTFLIHKVDDDGSRLVLDLSSDAEFALSSQPPSRKRRRGYSDISMTEPSKYRRLTGSRSPELQSPLRTGARSNLAAISNDMFRELLKLLKSTSPSTRQASMAALKDMIAALQGGATEYLEALLGPTIDMVNSSNITTQSISVNAGSGINIQSQALQLISEVTKTHSSKVIHPYVPEIVSAVVKAVQSKNSKFACEALNTLRQLVKVMTPPRNVPSGGSGFEQLNEILDAIVGLVTAKSADLSVRQEAINVIGTLLGRVIDQKGAKLLSPSRRADTFELLYDTCKNETTRSTSIRAIEAIMTQAPEGSNFDQAWFSRTALELAAQLRKADRSLRSASVQALRVMFLRHLSAQNLDLNSSHETLEMVLPLLTSEDLQLLGPALNIITCMIQSGVVTQISDDMQAQVCGLAKASSASSALDPLCSLMQAIGQQGLGKSLMNSLLKEVGIIGSPSVVGKIIGNLVVFGGETVGVTARDFLQELETTPDARRKSLALSILGEIGLRSGASSDLSPELFTPYFEVDSEGVPLAAAIALGRASAGVGNLPTWVPKILNRIKEVSGEHWISLHAIREMLQYNESDREVLPFAGSLWDATLAASRSEENRTIGAECIANLTLIDPPKFLPALQSFLNDDLPAIRGIAILAFRDIFTIADASYDKELQPITVEVITTMMRDSDVENRRTALNTFNAAVRHKSALILPHMTTLQPLVVDQTLKDPSLTREVSMGPFKHVVDDGLEVRKNAYETLYSLLETAPQQVDVVRAYDRIIAGVNDDRGIQTLCNLMILKLASTAPEETVKRLEDLSGSFAIIMAYNPKENSIRQEFEKADEAKKAIMKVSLELARQFPNEASGKAKWSTYLEEMKQVKDGTLLKEVEKEVKDRDRP